MLNVVADLKQHTARDQRAQVAEVRAHAKALAAEMQGLSRAELFQRFFVNLDEMRAQARVNGTTLDIDEETWESD